MPPQGSPEAALDFLRWWAPEGPWVLTAISTDRLNISTETFRPADEKRMVEWISQEIGKRNVYFQVNPPVKDTRSKAKRENVKSLSWLHVDIDPRVGEDIEEEHARALSMLRAPPGDIPPPSAIVFSGGGLQGFWRLSDPMPIDGVIEVAEDAKRYNQALELAFGADHCHNVDRIMRLPGTINIPDERKRKKGRVEALAAVVELHDDRVYSLKDFTPAAPVQMGGAGFASAGSSTLEADKRVRVEVSDNVARLSDISELDEWNVPDRVKVICVQGHHPDEVKAGDNSRSAWIFDAVCNMLRAGVPDQVIYSVLTDPEFAISARVLERGANAGAYAVRQIERAKEHVISPELRQFNERFAIIGNMGGKCRVIEEVDDPVLGRPRLTRQSYEDFRNRFNRVYLSIPDPANPGNTKQVKAGKWWLDHPQSRYYDHLIFSPQGDRPGAYNMWRGFAVNARPGNDHEIFLSHTRDIICNGNQALYEYVMGWLARLVQMPWLPGEVAPVLRGGKGIGKSLWVGWIADLLGRHSMQVSNPSHLVGTFNSHLRDCVLLFADEAFYAGDKKHESVLSTLITERVIMIEGKGVDAEAQPNHIHLIMASNNTWVVPAGMDERRYLVLDVSNERQGDHEYFARFVAAKRGGLECLLHHLLTLDISGFNVRSVPRTQGLEEQKLLSMTAEDEWWYGKLVQGAMLPHHTEWHREVRCDLLVEDYIEHAKNTGVLRRATPTALGRFLTRALPEGFPRSFQKLDRVEGSDGYMSASPRRLRFYQMPTLEACRARFVERFGFQGEWDAEPLPPEPERQTTFSEE